jgi:hypothetical protein
MLAEDLMCIESREYLKRARRVHVTVSEVLSPGQSESDWQTAYDGDRYLP